MIDKETIFDLLFYLEKQKENYKGARSHFKEGTKKYKWYDDFVHTYEKAYWYVQSYYFDRLKFDKKYSINEKGRKR